MPTRCTAPTPAPTNAVEEIIDDPWSVLLFDDPVNTMEYVSFALRSVLHISAERAEQLMLEAHTTGRAVVFSGDRSEAETVCVALHTWSLQATVAR